MIEGFFFVCGILILLCDIGKPAARTICLAFRLPLLTESFLALYRHSCITILYLSCRVWKCVTVAVRSISAY